MKSIMARSSFEGSFSFSKRHFCWRMELNEEEDGVMMEEALTSFSSSSQRFEGEMGGGGGGEGNKALVPAQKRKLQIFAVSLRSMLTFFGKHRSGSSLGNRAVGTLFGYRRGHVHLAFQEDPKSYPAFLIEIATPTSGLIREMASGLVRIALECDKKKEKEKKGLRLLEEPLWRSYCNGKKCGFAMMFACGPDEWNVLKALEPISSGAGVFPGNGNNESGSEGELMYMRSKFERVVGSKDSEAFYMMNPDGRKGPELSVFLLRV